jgi:hypothetical protein
MFGDDTTTGFGSSTTTGFGDYSSSPVPAPTKGKFSDWSGEMFGALSNLGSAFLLSKGGYVGGPGYNQGYYDAPRKNPNTILYVGGAIVLLAILYIFTKK